MNGLTLRLDPWATEYNTAYYAEQASLAEKENVDTSVELNDWQAVTPLAEGDVPYARLLFMDGTRRLDARVLLEDERQQVAFGALGTFGIGVIDCCSSHTRRAQFVDLRELQVKGINRLCALSGGRSLERFSIRTHLRHRLGELAYEVESTDERDADAVVRRIQFAMLRAESLLTSRLIDAYDDALVITDGPLPRMGFVANVVGYVKTIHEVKISEAQLSVVRGLAQGQRSPIYLVSGNDKSQQRFEWFLRLRDPNPWLYSLAGMVRLQAYASSNPAERVAEVRDLADWLAYKLPRFASQQHQDPRAPQQLLPVRALETELRRHMGDAGVIRRRIMRHLQAVA